MCDMVKGSVTTRDFRRVERCSGPSAVLVSIFANQRHTFRRGGLLLHLGFVISSLDVDVAGEGDTYNRANDSHGGINRGGIPLEGSMCERVESRLAEIHEPTKAGNHTVDATKGGKTKDLGGVVTVAFVSSMQAICHMKKVSLTIPQSSTAGGTAQS